MVATGDVDRQQDVRVQGEEELMQDVEEIGKMRMRRRMKSNLSASRSSINAQKL